jgi:hypothetical protein
MLFNDRDLGLLGAGALLTVLCLVLPLPFVGKAVLGLFTLVGFTILALLRLGPDRIPLEIWLLRRVRFRLQAHRYTYQQPGYTQPRPQLAKKSKKRAAPPADRPTLEQVEAARPIVFALDGLGTYPLVTVLLAVIGVYVLVWLMQGGAQAVASLIGGLSR